MQHTTGTNCDTRMEHSKRLCMTGTVLLLSDKLVFFWRNGPDREKLEYARINYNTEDSKGEREYAQ